MYPPRVPKDESKVLMKIVGKSSEKVGQTSFWKQFCGTVKQFSISDNLPSVVIKTCIYKGIIVKLQLWDVPVNLFAIAISPENLCALFRAPSFSHANARKWAPKVSFLHFCARICTCECRESFSMVGDASPHVLTYIFETKTCNGGF